MAGHSKWAKVKRAKAVTDQRRGKLFSQISKEITLAARAGGGNPDMNSRLRTFLLKAREANLPADNIDRAIKKGTGELGAEVIEEISYEGYATSGVALVVQVTTDNKNRTASEVRSTFAKHGGNLAGAGAVMFQFQHCGQFLISKDATSEDVLMELALDAGADDIRSEGEGFEVLTPVNSFYSVSAALEKKGIKTESAEVIYRATSTVPVTSIEEARRISNLIEALDDLDDVKAVFGNAEFPEGFDPSAE
jgi:YebC/PmpR family DNA-binding regulatory protein